MSITLALIGVGHIGGSVALGLRDAAAVSSIQGYDPDAQALEHAQAGGVLDRICTSPEAAIEDAELIVLAAPPSATAEICNHIAAHLQPDQTVTDVGSVKAPVLNDLVRIVGSVPSWFVPGHPISGTEKSGVQHADGTLFRDRYAVLTPLDDTDSEKLQQVRWMWEQLGARTELMPAEEHDVLFAGVSHLPHVLAYALMEMLALELPREDLRRYAAGGLLDFTRIASSNPDLWTDICHANREQLAPMLERYQQHLGTLQNALREESTEVLRNSFDTAKKIRDTLNHSNV